MNSVEIDQRVEGNFSFIERYIFKILKYLKIDNWEISVVICGESFIKELNSTYRDKKTSTDILTFPQSLDISYDETVYIGDIVLCPAKIEKNCEKFKEKLNKEYLRLLIHGILHLMGEIHKSYDKTEPMLVKQEKILKEIFFDEFF